MARKTKVEKLRRQVLKLRAQLRELRALPTTVWVLPRGATGGPPEPSTGTVAEAVDVLASRASRLESAICQR